MHWDFCTADIDRHGWCSLAHLSLFSVSRACSTSSPKPGALPDDVGQLVELQVYSGAPREVAEALRLGDVVLHFLQVGEQRRLLRGPSGQLGLFHSNADRARLQCFLSHLDRLQGRKYVAPFVKLYNKKINSNILVHLACHKEKKFTYSFFKVICKHQSSILNIEFTI